MTVDELKPAVIMIQKVRCLLTVNIILYNYSQEEIK